MRTLALLLTGLSAALTAPAASVPRPSPELTMQRGGAAPLQLSQFRGKNRGFGFRALHVRSLPVSDTHFECDSERLRGAQRASCGVLFLKTMQGSTIRCSSRRSNRLFPTGYTNEAEVKKYLLWNDKTDGILMIPYMIFIDASGTIRGDFNGKDGFFGESDKRIRAELDKMTKKTAGKAPVKKKEASK